MCGHEKCRIRIADHYGILQNLYGGVAKIVLWASRVFVRDTSGDHRGWSRSGVEKRVPQQPVQR